MRVDIEGQKHVLGIASQGTENAAQGSNCSPGCASGAWRRIANTYSSADELKARIEPYLKEINKIPAISWQKYKLETLSCSWHVIFGSIR